MPPTPYHVRLSVSQYGDTFRSELFTEDLGDTEGDVLTELPPSIAEWVPYLAQGADLPPDAARQLGKDLFAALLGQPENAKKWAEVLTQAARKGQSVRLLIDATTEAVRDLPYGLLCEPHDDWFLFRGGKKTSVEFIRIIRRCSPRPLRLRGPLQVLVAVAEPTSDDVPPFNAAAQLQSLAKAVRPHVDLHFCGPDGPKPLADVTDFTPFTKTTREALRKALAGEYAVFHLLAHGHGAGVLLCTADGKPAETTAGELAEWCGAGQTPMAYLQVCKAGQTASRGGFGGVAQQLLNPRGGNMAAVVASTFPLDADRSTDAAAGFYKHLADGMPPELALTADRPETDWSWAFLELWARPGAVGGGTQRAAFQFVSPYRGLSSFGEQDADLFFGRKTEVVELMQILRTEPTIAVVGDSGSGKTSLLQAGLVHALRREGLAGCDQWRTVSLRPGYRPAQALLAALTGSTEEPTPTTLAAALATGSQPLVVVFDQFEEVFTLARDKAEVGMLTEALANATREHGNRFRLVLGMRSEFLGQAASVYGLSRLIRRPWVLRPPGADDLREIVAGPAEHCGYSFQGPLADGNPAHAVSLLDRILADPLLAQNQGGQTAAPLPLLQFALERLWLKAVDAGVTEFTHQMFDEIGGMGKAIAQHAEAVYLASGTATDAGPQGQAIAEPVITALVSPRGTRQPRSREALQAETGHPDVARAVVDYLVGERLLTVRTDPEDLSKSLVDLSHEAIITNWDRLHGWLAEDPAGRAMREEFRTAAEKWEEGVAGIPPKSKLGLPGSDVARNFLAWIQRSSPRLTQVQQEFAKAMEEMLVRARRVRRTVAVMLGLLTIASLCLAVFAVGQAAIAHQNEQKAEKSAEDALAEQHKAEVNASTLALENGVEACSDGQPRTGILSIAYALKLCPKEETDLRGVIRTNLASWAPHLMCLDAIHTFESSIVATDPAGEYALLARVAETIPETPVVFVYEYQLFRIDSGLPVEQPFRVQARNLNGQIDRKEIDRVRLKSDKVALFTGDGFSAVWNPTTGKQVGNRWIEHGPGLADVRPDGLLVAGCDGRGKLRLFDTNTADPRATEFTHPGRVTELCFSQHGQYLVTGCNPRADATTDGMSASPPIPGDPAAESPTALMEGEVHLYAVGNTPGDPSERKWEKKVDGLVTCVQISPDLMRVTGGGFKLWSWDLACGEELANSRRQSPECTSYIAFDPNRSSTFIACSPSGALHIFHADERPEVPAERLTPQGWLNGVGFCKDGRVFTANWDGTVRVWHRPIARDSKTVFGREFAPPNAGAIMSVAFAPDSQRIALGSRNGVVYVYHLDPAKSPADPQQFQCSYHDKDDRQPITTVQFSPDGTRLIAQDQTLRTFVFDTFGGKGPLKVLGVHKPLGVTADGHTAVYKPNQADSYALGPLNPNAGAPPAPALAPQGGLAALTDETTNWVLFWATRVAISPNKGQVALLNSEGKIDLFDADTGERICPPLQHTAGNQVDSIFSVAFCPRGVHLLTRSNSVLGVWSATTGEKIHTFDLNNVQVAEFSPSGLLVIGGTNYTQAEVWRTDGEKAVPFALVHRGLVCGVAVDSKDERAITASLDHTARIWDLKTGRPISPPLRHRHGVSEATFNSDSTLALTGSWDGTARLWAVPKDIPDEQERIEAWIETMTGLRILADGEGAELLPADEWRKRKETLDKLGGPPIDIDR